MIDVVIVAKNEERHIVSVLKSLSNQVNIDAPVKVILVDNGSTDRTNEIATANGAKVIRCAGSLGHARNHGIRFGANKFVAFLDGHSVPSDNWACEMLKAFELREDVGGCMGSIENVCARPGAQLFAKESIFASTEKLWRNTISGLNASLPWIPTGNCMYLRSALDSVGGFTESLFRCEDTDLSWKVVLRGYQLVYRPTAKVVHYDEAGATAYWKKYFNYGAGAAELAERYGLKQNRKSKGKMQGTRAVLDFCYNMGFKTHQRFKLIDTDLKKVDAKFRPYRSWRMNQAIALSRSAIFWYPSDDTCICVELTSGTRIKLTESGLLIFQLIERGLNREQVVSKVCDEYGIAKTDAENDVDQFVQYLFDEKVIVEAPWLVKASDSSKIQEAAPELV